MVDVVYRGSGVDSACHLLGRADYLLLVIEAAGTIPNCVERDRTRS